MSLESEGMVFVQQTSPPVNFGTVTSDVATLQGQMATANSNIALLQAKTNWFQGQYKIDQTGVNPPVLSAVGTVYANLGTLTPTYSGVGDYRITSDVTPFTAGKTFVKINNPIVTNLYITCKVVSTSVIEVKTYSGIDVLTGLMIPADVVLTDNLLEILIYP